MNYDEIDQYVDQLFKSEQRDTPEILPADWSNDRVDQIIEDAYDEVIRWHNSRISQGSDPQSGLHGLPYIPWDERIDGVIAGGGAIGSAVEVRNYVAESVYRKAGRKRGGFPCVFNYRRICHRGAIVLYGNLWRLTGI